MPDPTDNRVAVYIDFDNIVISRYNQLFGARQFTTDRARNHAGAGSGPVSTRVREATVDVSAVLDYASSFGTIVVSRAYADWSVAVNAGYRDQLVDRAVDLVQLFPTVQSMKNGADIRLAVDVVEDLFRLDDLTHIVIVAGDSDYIALAQRCKRLGKYVVGIGVAGSTSRSLAAACDEFADYDALPGIDDTERGTIENTEIEVADSDHTDADPRTAATSLLLRAMQLVQAKTDTEWLATGAVKSQMTRMEPSFQESALGFKNFSAFVRANAETVEFDHEGPNESPRMRARPDAAPAEATPPRRRTGPRRATSG